jgi:hypothetical protein
MPWPEKSRPLAIERLEELDRLEKKARPGPWELVKQPDTRERAVSRVIAGFFAWNAPTPDAQLIVQMRNALPSLLTEVRQLRALRATRHAGRRIHAQGESEHRTRRSSGASGR